MWEQTRHRIARRKLLQGLGAGAALLAPFVRNRLVEAATGGNFLVFFTPNGHVRSKFGGTGSGPGFAFKPSLAPLEPYKSDVIVLQGVNNKAASTYATHEDANKFLSMYYGSGDYQNTYGPSFDQELATALGGPKPLTLGVSPTPSNGFIYSDISWVAANRSDPKLIKPIDAFNAAFGGAMPSSGAGSSSATAALLAERKSVLDAVKDDFAKLGGRLSGTNKQNLDLYASAIRQLETTWLMPGGSPSAPTCDSGAARNSVTASDGGSGIPHFKLQGEAMLDIALTAFACGTRRVATLVWGPEASGVNPTRSGGPDHHQVSHGENNLPGEWEAIDTWYAGEFAYAIKKAKSLGVLDDSVLLWGSGISEQHNQLNQVFVLAGGKNKGIKVGNNVTYPFTGNPNAFLADAHVEAQRSQNTHQGDIYVSIQKAFGVQKDWVGDKQWCRGGLSEVF
jgi:hypothetical protein